VGAGPIRRRAARLPRARLIIPWTYLQRFDGGRRRGRHRRPRQGTRTSWTDMSAEDTLHFAPVLLAGGTTIYLSWVLMRHVPSAVATPAAHRVGSRPAGAARGPASGRRHSPQGDRPGGRCSGPRGGPGVARTPARVFADDAARVLAAIDSAVGGQERTAGPERARRRGDLFGPVAYLAGRLRLHSWRRAPSGVSR
jgi:hypothetical protein